MKLENWHSFGKCEERYKFLTFFFFFTFFDFYLYFVQTFLLIKTSGIIHEDRNDLISDFFYLLQKCLLYRAEKLRHAVELALIFSFIKITEGFSAWLNFFTLKGECHWYAPLKAKVAHVVQ